MSAENNTSHVDCWVAITRVSTEAADRKMYSLYTSLLACQTSWATEGGHIRGTNGEKKADNTSRNQEKSWPKKNTLNHIDITVAIYTARA